MSETTITNYTLNGFADFTVGADTVVNGLTAVMGLNDVYDYGTINNLDAVIDDSNFDYITIEPGGVLNGGTIYTRDSVVYFYLDGSESSIAIAGGTEAMLEEGTVSNAIIEAGAGQGGNYTVPVLTAYDGTVVNPTISGEVELEGFGTFDGTFYAPTLNSGIIETGGTLLIGSFAVVVGTISFSGTDGIAIIYPAADISGATFVDLVNGTIDLSGITYESGDTFSIDTLSDIVTFDVSGTTFDLRLAPADVHDSFSFRNGNLGVTGTEITAMSAQCYVARTRIKTPCGMVAVEKLEIGDRVSTNAGKSEPVIWIGRRDYDGRFIVGNHLALPVCIHQGALADGIPSRDLFVSPGHGIFLGGFLVPAWRLVNGVSVTQAEAVDSVSYYHIELPTHEILLAENCPAESFFDIGDRGQFQNVSINNGDSAPMVPLPRVEGGHLLHMIQSQINARAGITVPAAPQIHLLRGCIDLVTPGVVEGWAQDAANPESPVDLIIQIGDQIVGRALANEWRPDLRKAGLGSGCHGFKAKFPAEIAGEVIVRSYPDGTVLSSTNTSDFHQAYTSSLAVAGF